MARPKKNVTQENTATIGFEEHLWTAADKLRGNMDASEYKSVILGLIFLKYVSDKFDERYNELVNEGEGFEEDKDEYISENIFWVPVEARWTKIAEASGTESIGLAIDKAMRAIEDENKKLKGILPKNFARPELNQLRLGEIVDLFSNISMAEKGDTRDILGRAYEYCLSHFAANEGKNAGEFYTPACIVKTLVEILEPTKGRVYDPCCGSGGMFVQSARFVESHAGNLQDISVYGQESNPTTWKMATMNLAIRGIDANLGPKPDDTFANDLFSTLRFDYILANPPFNLKEWGGEKLKEDPRWDYAIPPEGNANFAWLQHMIHHLSVKGKMGVVLANGALSSEQSGEDVIRQKIVEADLVDGIVALPSQLFFNTAIPVSLWIISKRKEQPNKTLFIDARNLGTMVTRKLRELTEQDIRKISTTFDAFHAGTLNDKKGFCSVVDLDAIKAQNYILTPGRYVGIEELEDDSEPFEEKMTRLSKELKVMFEESEALKSEILQSLEKFLK